MIPRYWCGEAIGEYIARNHTELLVLPSGRSDLVGARCRCDAVPRLDEVDDVYICPENFVWTMVFTHERGSLGPYFCRAAWLGYRGWACTVVGSSLACQ